MKAFSIVWGLICLCIFGLLTVYGFQYAKIKDYIALEDKLEDVVKDINKGLEKEEIIKTTYTEEDILTHNEKISLKVEDDECHGYVLGKIRFGKMRYKGYLSCKEYETKGYKEVEDDQS